MEDLTNYVQCYLSKSGAEILIHSLHIGPERTDNEWIARFLADNGETVKLLPIGSEPNVKNPDAEIEGDIWEFKTNRVGSANSVDNEIRRAHRQADCILLWLAAEIEVEKLENAIYNRVRQCPNLLKCRFIFRSRLYEFSRAQITTQAFRGQLGTKGEGGPA
jgi:hypothetical protein